MPATVLCKLELESPSSAVNDVRLVCCCTCGRCIGFLNAMEETRLFVYEWLSTPDTLGSRTMRGNSHAGHAYAQVRIPGDTKTPRARCVCTIRQDAHTCTLDSCTCPSPAPLVLMNIRDCHATH